MDTKETSEMNFKEFIENGKKINNSTIAEFEQDVLLRMKLEGFSNEEIYNMPMPKLYDLYLEVIGRFIEDAFSKMSPIIEQNPALADHPALKNLEKHLKKSLDELEGNQP